MDKQTVFKELTAKLTDMGIPKEQINRQMKQFDDYLHTLGDDDYQKELLNLSDTDRAAQNIAAVLRGEASGGNAAESYTLPNISIFEEESTASPVKTAGSPANAENDDEDIVIARPRRPRSTRRPVASGETIVTPLVGTTESVSKKKAADGKTQPGGMPTDDTVDIESLSGKGKIPEKRVTTETETARKKAAGDSGLPARTEKPLPSSMIRFSELDNESAVNPENQKMFWIVFCVTSPILLMVLLAIASLFAGAFLFLSGIIAFCLVALVGISAVGACGSLFGMIYGVIQVIGHSPAGLYEVGFAMIVAGGTLFAGILLYNLAIRLMPIALRYLFKFFRYTVNQGIRLFHFVKRECTGK